MRGLLLPKTAFLATGTLLFFFPSGALTRDPQVKLRDVTADAGIHVVTTCGTLEKKLIVEGNGSGCAWIDYNNDGWVDLFIVNGIFLENLRERTVDPTPAPNYLLRNNGDGTFTEVTAEAGVLGFGLGNGVAAADFNNNGHIDLFVTNYGEDILYRNNGDGTFTNVAREAGVAGGWLWSTGATFGDYDRDGWVDLYVARYLDFDVENPPREGEFCNFRGLQVLCGPSGLPAAPDILYRNNGDGTFTEVTREVGVQPPEPRYGFSAVFEDFDNDGFPDLFVANDSGPNFLFHNQGDGTFKELALVAGVAYNREGRAQADMGLAVADIDHSGLSSVFTTTFSEDYYPLFHNRGGLLFEEISAAAGLGTITLPYLGWAAFFFDFDNDGRLDLFVGNGHLYPEVESLPGRSYRQPDLLFRGTRSLRFEDVSQETGLGHLPLRSSRGAAYCDYDNDGDLDLIVLAIDDSPTLLRNEGGNRRNWLQLRLKGLQSNSAAIGAAVRVVAGDLVQNGRVRSGGSYLSQNDLRLHFGLDHHEGAELVEVCWPSGVCDRLENVKANQLLELVEGETGVFSCGPEQHRK